MKRPGLRGQRLIALFAAGCLLFNYPLLSLFNTPQLVFGVPLLYLYVFAVWVGLVLITVVIVGRAG